MSLGICTTFDGTGATGVMGATGATGVTLACRVVPDVEGLDGPASKWG